MLRIRIELFLQYSQAPLEGVMASPTAMKLPPEAKHQAAQRCWRARVDEWRAVVRRGVHGDRSLAFGRI